jgi:Asp-tRNA(Asn)/Glu-tRNA(Gln) amidotransferase C subunit
MNHPEVSSELNEIIDFVEQAQIVDIWCHGCKMYRQMNAVYAKHVKNGLDSCRFCRNGGMLD